MTDAAHHITPEVAAALVDGLVAAAPGHVANTRPVHAVGIGATGYFRGSHAAARYTRAEHFGREWTPVTMRFSSANGYPSSELLPQVRGMALKFHLGQKSFDSATGWHGEREADMVTMSIPVFFTKTVDDTLRYLPAARPVPVKRPSWIRQLAALAQLSPLPVDPPGVTMSPAAGFLKMAAEYPPSQATVFTMGSMAPPVSYVRSPYFAVHAFDVENAAGEHHLVRFTWEPVEGARNETRRDLPDDYLRRELGEHLDRGPAQFILRMQIADPWDDATDPTVAWPASRRRVTMGRLIVERLIGDQQAGCEQLSFNPGRLVPGIAMSDDPILHARAAAYVESCGRRAGSGCPMDH